ncbi:MAG: MtrB/PioB family outer membrane beta-barrel protein [Gemmatimonadaceae bacterium]
MTYATKISAFVAMGLLMAVSTATAQQKKAPVITSGGEITYRALGQDYGVESSKFTEYREVPNGTSIPYMNLWSSGGKVEFDLSAYNVQQKDQQYLGKVSAHGLGLKFNYNSIPHAMGNNARSIYSQTAPGVWSMSTTVRQALQNAVNVPGSTTRTLPTYQALLAPSFASANELDINGVRRTGNVELNLGNRLPLDVTFMYRNEFKSGSRGQAGLNENFRISPAMQVAGPLDEVTNDFGVRAARNFARGNAYVTFNRNMYDNRIEALMIDYPFQAFDAPVTAAVGTTVLSGGGPSRERAVMAPDNSANTATAGFLLKFKKQTRINAGMSVSSRMQDATFYGFTAYSLARTTAGVDASTNAAMPQRSLNGKTNATTYNVSVSSRPIEGLDLRAQYRVNELTDKTKRFLVPGDVLGVAWSGASATAADPYGFATANVYDTKSSRFTASAAYDFKALTVEGQVRSAQLERTAREAEKGTESGMGVTALYHYNDWVGFRGTYDVSKRTAKGETIFGFQADEAPITNTRTGIDVELSPLGGLDLSFGYIRRNVDYTDRPDRVVVASGVPVAGVAAFPNTPSGLLNSKYDSYTGEINWVATDRVEVGAFATYEKDARTDQWSTTTGSAAAGYKVNNLVSYAGSDKTNTYGGNAVIHVVPEKATLIFNAVSQKVNGLMDITALETGSFYTPGRTTLIPAGQGGAKDVDDWDDTEINTLSAQFDYTMTKAWTIGVGYTYEKYDFSDAYVVPNNELLTTSTIIQMKPNDGAYKVNLVYAKLNFRF